MTDNKSGLEKLKDKISGALEDMRKYGEGKVQTDWGKGCEATMEKCLLNIDQAIAEEQARNPTAPAGLVEDLKRIITETDEEIKAIERSQTDYCDGTINEVVCYVFKMMTDELKAVVSRHTALVDNK